MKKMKKILAILVALVLCLSLFAGCGENDKALAKIGDYKITQAYYNFIYSIVYSQWSQYEQYYGPEWLDSEIEEGMTIKEAMTDSARDQIEQLAVASIIAKDRYGITAKTVKEKVENQKKEIIESYGARSNFDAFLNEIFFLVIVDCFVVAIMPVLFNAYNQFIICQLYDIEICGKRILIIFFAN